MTQEEAGKKLSAWAKYMEDPSAVPELDQPCTDDEIIEAMSIAGKALSGTSTANDGLDEAAEYFDDVIAKRMFDEEGKDVSEIVRAAVKFGAERQKEQMMDEWLKDRDGCFWDGVEEGKKAMEKQMMEEAVEANLLSIEVSEPGIAHYTFEGKKVPAAFTGRYFGYKIIVIKDEK